MKRYAIWLAAVMLIGGMLPLVGCQVVDDLAERSYSTKVYKDTGGDRLVVASGGEVQIESGGVLDVQAGSTLDLAANLDMNNATITNIGAAGTDFDSSGGLTLATELGGTTDGTTV